jgi:hypothetical protein
MIRLKNLFNSIACCWRYPETKTFVRFELEGRRARPQIVEVKDRNIKTLSIPKNAMSFFYFDREIRPGRKLDDAQLLRKSFNTSPTYVFGDRLMTVREFNDIDYFESAKFRGHYNQDTEQDSRVVIDGDVVRTVNARWRPNEAVISRLTREQIWPPQRLPMFGPKAKP